MTLHPIPPLEGSVLTETPVKRRGQNETVSYRVKKQRDAAPNPAFGKLHFNGNACETAGSKRNGFLYSKKSGQLRLSRPLNFFRLFYEVAVIAFNKFISQYRKSRTDHRAEQECPEACDGIKVAAEHCEHSGAEAAGRVNGSTGEVDSEEMNACERKADDQTAEGAVLSFLGGNADDSQYKDKGEQDLNNKTCEVVAAYVCHCVGAETVEVMRKTVFLDECKSVRGSVLEVFGSIGVRNTRKVSYKTCAENECKEACRCKCACKLSGDVADEIGNAQLALEQKCKGNSGINVTAGNVSDAVSDNYDRKTEGQSGGNQFGAGNHRGSAADEYQNEGSDAFSYVLFDGIVLKFFFLLFMMSLFIKN